MTRKESPAKKTAPPKTTRAKRNVAAADDDGNSSQEAPVVKRPRGRPAKDTSLPTTRSRSAKPAAQKAIATRASDRTMKGPETPPPDADVNVPSTSKGLSRKAPRVSRKTRSHSSSPSDASSAAVKAPKLRIRPRSHSPGSSSYHAKRGKSRGRSRHSSHSGRVGPKRKGSHQRESTTDSETSHGIKRGQNSRRRHSKSSSSTASATTKSGGRKRRRHVRSSHSTSTRVGRRVKSKKAASSSSSRSRHTKRTNAPKATKSGKRK